LFRCLAANVPKGLRVSNKRERDHSALPVLGFDTACRSGFVCRKSMRIPRRHGLSWILSRFRVAMRKVG
jgi:hypothetical protein